MALGMSLTLSVLIEMIDSSWSIETVCNDLYMSHFNEADVILYLYYTNGFGMNAL